jgi:hypothetical protein
MTEQERREIMAEISKLRDAFHEFREETGTKLATLSLNFTNHLTDHRRLADVKTVRSARLYDMVKTIVTIIVTVTVLTLVKAQLVKWGF